MTIEKFISTVRSLVNDRTAKALSGAHGNNVDATLLMPGKMLRSRLAGRLFVGSSLSVNCASLQAMCAATELIHTASLCHDDVVDNSMIRRLAPTLWRTTSPSGAILIGDLLLCQAMDLIIGTEGGRYVVGFMTKVQEVIEAEAEQELIWRGREVNEQTCLRLARSKTGPLFAFVAEVCGGDDQELAGALAEAGYRIGTAYQLADDLLDLIGQEDAAGKTLGTDLSRGKYTLPQGGMGITREHVADLCLGALEALRAWPELRNCFGEFIVCDIQPLLKEQLDVSLEIAI